MNVGIMSSSQNFVPVFYVAVVGGTPRLAVQDVHATGCGDAIQLLGSYDSLCKWFFTERIHGYAFIFKTTFLHSVEFFLIQL
jgi:hypothetical protein